MDKGSLLKIALVAAAFVPWLPAGGKSPATPASLVFYATSSGQLALDEGEGGGNPFASAFIESLAEPHLTLSALSKELPELTLSRSGRRQVPELPIISNRSVGSLDLKSRGERRVALVIGISHYGGEGVPSLPGVAYDIKRIAAALRSSGFVTQELLDPDMSAIQQQLQNFSAESKGADISLLYATGHSVEVQDGIHLLMGDFPLSKGRAALATNSLPISALAKAGQARYANLVLYGGCRNDPF